MKQTFSLLLLAGLAAACSATDKSSDFDEDTSGATASSSSAGGSGGAGGDAAGASTPSSSGIGGSLTVGASSSGSGNNNFIAEVYGHSPDELFKLDPLTNTVTVVGSFDGCSSVIDIAIDKDFNLFATSYGGLYTIDRVTAKCTLVSEGQYPNSLGFVPIGTIYQDKEALVGYFGSDYVAIDTVTGAKTNIGAIQGGYLSSGDVVSVIGGGTYLTVVGNGCSDCLVQVDPTTGDITKNWGAVGQSQVFGLAFWGGVAYGFSNAGTLFQINFGSDSVTTSPVPVQNAPAGLKFWGAGSSTEAPVEPPK